MIEKVPVDSRWNAETRTRHGYASTYSDSYDTTAFPPH